jgi:DNA-binding response OmpR family regulator
MASKGRILVVDDDPHAVEILTRMLEREGYECLAAESGPAALQTLRENPVDVLLLDVMMPEMDGLQVCEKLQADEDLRRIPVMLLTARDDYPTRERGMNLGVSEFLTKPVNKRELFSRIEAQLHAREIDRKLSETDAAVASSDPPPRKDDGSAGD